MGLGDLLIPAVGGYLFLTCCHATKYRVAGQTGYQLLLKSISYGIIFFGISHTFVYFVMPTMPVETKTAIVKILPKNILPATILSFILGILSACIVNMVYWKRWALVRYAKANNDYIGGLIGDATDKKLPIHITLDDGKVYVGEPLNTLLRRSENAEIAIVPWLSGHRDKNTGKMKIDVDYAPAIMNSLARELGGEELGDEEGLVTSYRDYRLIVPLSRVVSARLFSPQIYHRFFDEESQDP